MSDKRETFGIDKILQDFGEYPEHLSDEVMVLANIMAGNRDALYIHNPRWSEARRQRFIRKVWNTRDSYRRDVLNQPFDGVTWPLESPQGYGEDYTITLIDYSKNRATCQAQFEGYGNPKYIAIGVKVILAIADQSFEGQAGEVIAESHGKWLVSFPTEDGTVHGRFATHELLNLGDYREKVQDSQDLGKGSTGR